MSQNHFPENINPTQIFLFYKPIFFSVNIFKKEMNKKPTHVSHSSCFFPSSTKNSLTLSRLPSLSELNTTKSNLTSPRVPSLNLKRMESLESLANFLPPERNFTPYSVSRSLVTPYSGIFETQRKASPDSMRSVSGFDEPEKAVDHFMQILYIILKNAIPDFELKVMKACPNLLHNTTRGSNSAINLAKMTRNRIIIKTKSKEEKNWQILKALIINPSSALNHENENFRTKAAIFKKFIGEMDPEGINSKWWSKLGLY